MILKVYKMVFIHQIYKSLTEFLEEIYGNMKILSYKKSARSVKYFCKKVCKMVFISTIFMKYFRFLSQKIF